MAGPSYSINAWRELLARVFADAPCQYGVTPSWLINPATKRSLKLDLLYPDMGIAVRFEGIKVKGQSRQSDEEKENAGFRDETRYEVCRANGIELVRVDAYNEDPLPQLDALIRAISRAGRVIEQGELSVTETAYWMTRVAEARMRASQLRDSIARNTEQMMANLNDAWRDREALLATAASAPSTVPGDQLFVPNLGQRIQHERYGAGVVMALEPEKDDRKLTILFDAGEEKVFLLSLVQGKIAAHS